MTSQKKRVALMSLLASIGLTIVKFIVGMATGSLGILSDALHSLLDVGATAITFLAVRISDKPADREHHFGHGKIESVTALAETGLLFVTGAWIVYEAVKRLVSGEDTVTVTWWAVAVIAAAIVVDFNRSRALKRAAEETRSEALTADALHFQSDMLSSGAVLIGLFASWAGFPAGDAFAAIAVAVVVGLAGYRLGRRTIDTLTDAAPEGAAERVAEIAASCEGVLGLKRVRVRPVGAATFIDADITVRRTLPLDRVTHIQEAFIKAVEDAFEEADVSVTTVPVALDDETVFEKVMLVSTRRGIAVHHLTVQHVGESLSVSLDIEVPADWSYWRAHDVATQLENAIANELGEDVEVETHIEPAHITGLDGHDAAADVVEDFTAQLKRLAAPQPVLSNIHDVRVRENAHGLFVTFHCWVDRNLSVDTVHDAVDELERTFREERPQVRRVIAHAEPFGAD